jgi:hypothetical protein
MEQRRLRLGDILDDYCPRERRVTNHAVVAMIEEDVKQTRCTTCDAEHSYKGARVPVRRKKETPAALFKEVLAGMPEADDVPLHAVPAPAASAAPPAVVLASDAAPARSSPEKVQPQIEPVESAREVASVPAQEELSEAADAADFALEDDSPVVDGPVHRPLIRATLPRIEGQKEERRAPDFTIRHTTPRGNGTGHGGFRGDRDRMRMGSGGGNGNTHGHGNSNRANGGPRFQANRGTGGGRSPMGRAGGPSSGFRGTGNGNGNAGNGNKRGRGSRG